MPLSSFAELIKRPGSPLQPERTVNAQQVADWIAAAEDKLKDASRTENSSSTRMDAAYDAALFAALAVAAASKYRVSAREGHHIVALEGAARAIGYTESRFDEVDSLREWRNRKYTAGFTAKEQDISDAVDTARLFLDMAIAWLELHLPKFSQR